MMPLMILKEVADLYYFGTQAPSFYETYIFRPPKSVSQKIMAVEWLTWLICDSGVFTRLVISLFNQADIASQ